MKKILISALLSSLLFSSEKVDVKPVEIKTVNEDNKSKIKTDKKEIVYNVKTELNENGLSGFIIYADKKKTKKISTLNDSYLYRKQMKEKENKNDKDILPMPEIYKTKCVSCHGELGEKKPKIEKGVVSFLGGMSKMKSRQKLMRYHIGKYSLGNGKIMQDIMKGIPIGEIETLSSYIGSLPIVKEKKKMIGPQRQKEEVDLDKIE